MAAASAAKTAKEIAHINFGNSRNPQDEHKIEQNP